MSDRSFFSLLKDYFVPRVPCPNEKNEQERKTNGEWLNRYCINFVHRWQFLMLVMFFAKLFLIETPISFIADVGFIITAVQTLMLIIIMKKLRQEFGEPKNTDQT